MGQRHARNNVDPHRVRALVDQGATIREICDQLGAGYSSVRYWIVKLGLRTERMERKLAFEKPGERDATARMRSVGITATRCSSRGRTEHFAALGATRWRSPPAAAGSRRC
jgi:hypothetical protein